MTKNNFTKPVYLRVAGTLVLCLLIQALLFNWISTPAQQQHSQALHRLAADTQVLVQALAPALDDAGTQQVQQLLLQARNNEPERAL